MKFITVSMPIIAAGLIFPSTSALAQSASQIAAESPAPATASETAQVADDVMQAKEGQEVSTRKLADSTPFLTVKKITSGNESRPHYCYFRLDIKPTNREEYEQLGHVPRGWFARMTRGVDYSFNALLKVKAGLYEDTVILYSRKYRSSRKEGEVFDRSMLVAGSDYPVFLLQGDANRQASIAVSADMKKTQTFQLAGAALEAVSAGLKSVSPASDIITTLTSDSAKAVAQKIDQGAGAFVGVSGINAETYDLQVSKNESLQIDIFGPRYEIDTSTEGLKWIGSWKASFVAVATSYFYQDVGCQNDAQSMAWQRRGTSRNLLSTVLVSNVPQVGTLGAYLKQTDWWTEAQKGLTGKAKDSAEIAGFCRRIVDSVTSIGFNTVDAYLAADAVSRSSLVGSAEGAAMRASAACDFEKGPALTTPAGRV